MALVAAVLAAVLSPSLAQEAEPSEAEMRAAVAQWLRDVHAPWDDTAQLCTGSPVQRRLLPPDICSQICAPDSSNCRVPGEVKTFRKGACRLPVGNGRVECSFAAEYIAISPRVKETGMPSQGLFDRSSGQWRFSPAPSQ